MIVRGFYTTREDGVTLYVTKSDKGVLIRKIGTDEVYDAAIDVAFSSFVYEETDIPAEKVEEPDTIGDQGGSEYV